ncbi:hypothetical protein [Ferruginivarius sediminum]|uniref:Uncharacterized protein n=1 Tax=Ferruginivarius sediminum TaxID=2661937 RepID=A0A369TH06_9PROT|nr:hypothetical protein [Ferruginivarius sediminum]RDD63417.1 hypothetical protein DRB17_02950 [Ferruginivarius sediminum]
MTDKLNKISFDLQGAMRQLGRMTRKGVDTVKGKAEALSEDDDREERNTRRDRAARGDSGE